MQKTFKIHFGTGSKSQWECLRCVTVVAGLGCGTMSNFGTKSYRLQLYRFSSRSLDNKSPDTSRGVRVFCIRAM